jgi:hypothetical protein
MILKEEQKSLNFHINLQEEKILKKIRKMSKNGRKTALEYKSLI